MESEERERKIEEKKKESNDSHCYDMPKPPLGRHCLVPFNFHRLSSKWTVRTNSSKEKVKPKDANIGGWF